MIDFLFTIPLARAHICARRATSPCCTSRSPSFTSYLTKSLGAESFLHVTVVYVWVFSRLSLVLPASWRDAGPRMGGTPVSRHRTRHITGFTLVSTLWWVHPGSYEAAWLRNIAATDARVDFAPMHMWMPTGASTCHPLSWFRVVLF